ncbi:MAG: beta-N-acetylhexosaminidase [Planctomycetaceae bacterium]|nr:beta-N-acetylhexosaminidase [Planctomycetaceae bacterium]
MQTLRTSIGIAAVVAAAGLGTAVGATDSIPADPLAGVTIQWRAISNDVVDRNAGSVHCQAELVLTNASDQPRLAGAWRLYFNFSGTVEPVDAADKITGEMIAGDFQYLAPADGFAPLAPGESRTVQVELSRGASRQCAMPSGHYVVAVGEDGVEGPPSEEFVVKPPAFEAGAMAPNGLADARQPVTPEERFDANAELSLLPTDDVPLVVPTPSMLQRTGAAWSLPPIVTVDADAALDNELAALQRGWGDAAPVASELALANDADAAAIRLRLDPAAVAKRFASEQPPAEAYLLDVDATHGVDIVASDPAGAFYGVQTLLALVGGADHSNSAAVSVPAVRIADRPRFGYRGLHLDVARNFQTKETVKKLLTVMARFKLNRLHLHLSDDEGWRLAIDALPELTQVGARRGHTRDESDRLAPSLGSGPDVARGPGSGFYSQDDFAEILQHAARLHIEVIPEFDFPGHARAAIVAMNARQRRLAVGPATASAGDSPHDCRLVHPDDRSQYKTPQGWQDDVCDVALDATYELIETVLVETAGIYQRAGARLRTFHVGGDEVPKQAWLQSPACQSLVERGVIDKLDHDELQEYFARRVTEIGQRHDVEIAGWEELFLAASDDGDVPNHQLLSAQPVAYVWNNAPGWRREDYAYRLANAGFDIVLCNVTSLYFDLAAEVHPEENGHDWGGFVPLHKPFELEPLDYLRTARTDVLGRPLRPGKFDDCVALQNDAVPRVRGIQGQLWGEYLRSESLLEQMAFPRAIALAERAWAPRPAWSEQAENAATQREFAADWNQFCNALGRRVLPQLDRTAGGVAYRLPPPGAWIDNGQLQANSAYPGLAIRYTTEPGEPTAESPLYCGPVEVAGSVRLRTFDTRGRGSRTVEVSPRDEVAAP